MPAYNNLKLGIAGDKTLHRITMISHLLSNLMKILYNGTLCIRGTSKCMIIHANK